MTPAAQSLELRGVGKTFRPPQGPPIQALRSVDLTIRAGEFAVVVGHNGSGKTTLLNVIAGTVPHDEGDIVLKAGTDLRWNGLPPWARARHIGRVYQNPTENVVSDFTVAENLSLVGLAGTRASAVRGALSRALAADASDALRDVGLDGRLDTRAGELSFGQQQLLALQLVTLRDPAVLLLDEPTAALDRKNAAQCLEFLERHWQRSGRIVIMVTHDLGVALRTGNRLIVLRDAAVAEDLNAERKASLDVETLFDICGFGVANPTQSHP